MKRLLTILLIAISAIASAQTYQLNYPDIRIGNSNTGKIVLRGSNIQFPYLGLGSITDSVVTVVDGVFKKVPRSQFSGGGSSGVSSFNGRTGAVSPLSVDYNAFYPLLASTYNNPTWINTLAYSKITGVPSFITTETDPTVPAYAKTLTAFSVIKASTDPLYLPITYTPDTTVYRSVLNSFNKVQTNTQISNAIAAYTPPSQVDNDLSASTTRAPSKTAVNNGLALKQNKFLINVKDYGATGDGVTNDYAAIMSAYSALPSTGGTLYFPNGKYLTNGGLVFDKPSLTILGENGIYTFDYATLQYVNEGSIIINNNATSTLLKITSSGANLQNIILFNKNSTPTSGANLDLSNAGFFNISNSSFVGGYTNVNLQNAAFWTIDRCRFIDPKLYNLIIDNVPSSDSGDNAISNSSFMTNSLSVVTNIKWKGSGGLRIISTKFNPANGGRALNHIDVTSFGTGQFQMIGCSLEGFTGNAIIVNPSSGNWYGNQIVGNYFAPRSATTGNIINTNLAYLSVINDNIFEGDGLQVNAPIKLRNGEKQTVLSNSFHNFSIALIDTLNTPNSNILTDNPTSKNEINTSGNSFTATKLNTSRSIGTTGIASTPANFDGSANVNIAVTAVPGYLVTGNITGKATGTTLQDVTTAGNITNLGINLGGNSSIGSAVSDSRLFIETTASNNLLGSYNNAGTVSKPLSINSAGGNVGIGTTAPTKLLDVRGEARITGTTIGTPGTDSLLVTSGGVLKKISPAYYSTGGGGGGTVTNFSRTDGYGITSSVSNPTTTPNLTIAVDTTSVNGLVSKSRLTASLGNFNVTSDFSGLGTVASPFALASPISASKGGAGTNNGILKANGAGVVTAAVSGTDYVVPSGNVATATALATSRNIWGLAFNGTANVTGKPVFTAGATGAASINIPQGVAPTSPVNGDIWNTSAVQQHRINGVTKTVAYTTDIPATPTLQQVTTAGNTTTTGITVGGNSSIGNATSDSRLFIETSASNNLLGSYNNAGTVSKPLSINSAGGNVLIGTTTDNTNKLQVNGTGYFSGNVGVGTAADASYKIIANGGMQLYNSTGVGAFITNNSTSSTLLIQNGGTGNMADFNGYVLIKNDGSILTSKDVEINDATKGLILKSPNGTRWRVTVSNTGVLTTTSL